MWNDNEIPYWEELSQEELNQEELSQIKKIKNEKLIEKDNKINDILSNCKSINFDSDEEIINWLIDLQLETQSTNFTPIKEEKIEEIINIFEEKLYDVSNQVNTWKDFKEHNSDNFTRYLVSLWISNLKNNWLPWVPMYMISEWKENHWKDAKTYKKILNAIISLKF
jgi:hypothetical protein